jgi:prevent-host-death family protein
MKNMAEVGIRALKQNASAVVARVASGDPITVTDRGRPVALLVPVTSSRVDALVLADLARPARRRLSELPEPAPARRGQASLTDELARIREAERA